MAKDEEAEGRVKEAERKRQKALLALLSVERARIRPDAKA